VSTNSNHTYCNEINSEPITLPKEPIQKPKNSISQLNEPKPQVQEEVVVKPQKQVLPKNMINLENILLLEGKLTQITANLLDPSMICELCEDWWELSQEETMLRNLGNVFKEPRFKQILRAASVLEVVGVTLCHCIALQNDTHHEEVIIGIVISYFMYI
jgi:hypothetical protein